MIKEYIKNIVLGKRSSSKKYVEYLRSIGMKIGNDVEVYVPSKTLIDEQYPWMITIGNHVRITEGVKILTHDYSWFVIKNYCGGILGASGTVEIGNNVFIGMNTIVEKNVKIGNNVIIGAGSVVVKDCEDNGVYAGVPAKRLMDIDTFFRKRNEKQIKEAKKLAIKYYERFGYRPPKSIFHEYFMLFENSEGAEKEKIFNNKLELCNTKAQSIEYMNRYKHSFANFEEFMRYCFERKE